MVILYSYICQPCLEILFSIYAITKYSFIYIHPHNEYLFLSHTFQFYRIFNFPSILEILPYFSPLYFFSFFFLRLGFSVFFDFFKIKFGISIFFCKFMISSCMCICTHKGTRNYIYREETIKS